MAQEAVGRAPGRVNLIGEHTDYNAGLCLPFAIDRRATVVARRRDDDRVSVTSAQRADRWDGALGACGPGQATGWAAYVVGVLWALQRVGWRLPGLDLRLDSAVPMGAGLSSSAAVETATAMAVCGVLDRPVTDAVRDELVAVCRAAETEVVGAPTGALDQTAVLHAVEGCALLLDFASGERRAVPLDPASAGLALIVTDTGAPHDHAAGGYARRREECEAAARRLHVPTLRAADPHAAAALTDPVLRRRARHVLTENARVGRTLAALEADDWSAVGVHLSLSHASLRDDFEVSCAELDATVDAALAAGALGARMTGGGFGGSTIALVRQSAIPRITAAVDAAFADAGWSAPEHVVVDPSGPAEVC